MKRLAFESLHILICCMHVLAFMLITAYVDRCMHVCDRTALFFVVLLWCRSKRINHWSRKSSYLLTKWKINFGHQKRMGLQFQWLTRISKHYGINGNELKSEQERARKLLSEIEHLQNDEDEESKDLNAARSKHEELPEEKEQVEEKKDELPPTSLPTASSTTTTPLAHALVIRFEYVFSFWLAASFNAAKCQNSKIQSWFIVYHPSWSWSSDEWNESPFVDDEFRFGFFDFIIPFNHHHFIVIFIHRDAFAKWFSQHSWMAIHYRNGTLAATATAATPTAATTTTTRSSSLEISWSSTC